MTQAKNGDTVKVHYTGRFEDGTEFDSSKGSDPLEFTLGDNQVIKGFEDAVLGMTPGDEISVTIPAENAYGDHQPDMVATVPLDQFPDDFKPSIGQQIEVRKDENTTFLLVVTEIGDDDVTLDANHPLAGKNLTFDIELVEIA